MRYVVKKLSKDFIGDLSYGKNSLIEDGWLEQVLECFDTVYGLFRDDTMLWTVVPHKNHWVATSPLSCAVFDDYLKNVCSLENKEPQSVDELDDDTNMLSYYLFGSCGGPGSYELNDDTRSTLVYLSHGSACRVAEDYEMEWIVKEQFIDLFAPEGDESGYLDDGVSYYSPLGFSAPIGASGQGAKEWGNQALMLPLAGMFNIMIQGFEHGYLRLAIEKSKVEEV